MRKTERVRIMERMRVKEEKREMEWWRDSSESDVIINKMAFVALNPLHLTILRLLHSTRVSMDPGSRQLLEYAGLGVKEALQLLYSLEKFREGVGSKRMEALEREISEAAMKLEDVLDSHVSHQFLSQSESRSQPLLYSLNLQGIEQDIDGFVQMVMKMEKLLNPWLEEEVDGEESDILRSSDVLDENRSSIISWFATKAASMFLGLKEDYIQDLENLWPQEEEGKDANTLIFPTGMTIDFSSIFRAGKIYNVLMIWWINKAASIFVMERIHTQRLVNSLPENDDLGIEPATNMVGSPGLFCEIRDHLLEDCETLRVGTIVGMAGIGKTALSKKIMKDPLISSKFECCIFVRLGPEYKLEETLRTIIAKMPDGDKMLMEEDVDLESYVTKILRDKKCLIVLDDFWHRGSQNIVDFFPRDRSESVVLVTTRINEMVWLNKESTYEVLFLNKDESWDLLRRNIFGEKRCPPELEKAGMKIAENCEGLPLLILAVASLLSHAEKTPECWSKIASNKTNSIFVDAYEQLLDVVYPSYYYLPQELKRCFLYLGAFPQNDEFRISRLICLWSADGFLGVPYTFLQEHAEYLLRKIVSNNVALGTQRSICQYTLKALSLHSVFWYLCKRESRNEKFLHVLNSYTDAGVHGIKGQRRLSIYKNILLSIKDVRESIASISNVRSFLCTGMYHQYEVQVCLGLRFLKVLDALTIRFYEFPLEVVKLVQLRYLAFTCNGHILPSISNLWGLQCLILHQHQSIKSSSVSQSYLPMEIWDLQELEHLQIMGRNLPDPRPGVVLRKLLILLDVGAHTCTKRVLAGIPNLNKLRVQIELMHVPVEPQRFCDDTSHLKKLRSVQFVVMNPELKFNIATPLAFGSFSTSLRKLTLSGFGYHWKDMHKIAKLHSLDDLKLKCYAFRGEKWEVEVGELKYLAYLSIEDTDLVEWTGNFRNLQYLTIKNCYRLLELPKLPSYLKIIRVVDCNPSVVTCAKQLESSDCRVYVDSSWLDNGKHS